MSAPPGFRLKATVMDAEAIGRSLRRIAHEIVERNRGTDGVVLVGVVSGGEHLAGRLAQLLGELEGSPIPVGRIDASAHRDDRERRTPGAPENSRIPDISGAVVVLVDDVIHHGRTVRAAMDAIMDFGRPRAIQLAVLVDRGHRELPIRPDFVGKNVPSRESELIEVTLSEDGRADSAVILER